MRVVLGWGGGPEALQSTEGEREEREETFLRSLNLVGGWRGVGGGACPAMHPAAVVLFLLPLLPTKQIQFIACIVCCLLRR